MSTGAARLWPERRGLFVDNVSPERGESEGKKRESESEIERGRRGRGKEEKNQFRYPAFIDCQSVGWMDDVSDAIRCDVLAEENTDISSTELFGSRINNKINC